MTEPTTQPPAEIPVADLPPLLRYGQARDLAARFGVTESAFRSLVAGGSIKRQRIGKGVRHYYFRDQIAWLLQPSPSPES